MNPAVERDKLFRRLAWSAFGTTFLLILLGGIVRISDSGLGCGPPGSGLEGWPLCGGRLLPVLDANQLVEYSHRTLASIVGLLVVALAVLAWRRHRDDRAAVRLSTAAAVLVVGEGILGGFTVEHDLNSLLVAAHLGISMLILATLLVLAISAGERAGAARPTRSLRLPALIAPACAWLTIVAGGYVAGTVKFGAVQPEQGGAAHFACGQEFPTCDGSLFPFGQSKAVNILLTHETLMYLTVAAVVWLAVATLRNVPSGGAAAGRARALAWVTLAALAGQVLLGAANLWFDLHRGLILGHLMLGTTLFLLTVALAFELLRPSRTASPS